MAGALMGLGLPSPVTMGVGMFNNFMGPFGVVGGPTAPQMGKPPGGVFDDNAGFRTITRLGDRANAMNQTTASEKARKDRLGGATGGGGGGLGGGHGNLGGAARDAPGAGGRRG